MDSSAFIQQLSRSLPGSATSSELVKLVLEYMAREQDQDAHNALLRELIKNYVGLTRTLQEQLSQIETQNRQLATLNVQKNEFLGIAAHDLRNPISVILMYAEMLQGMLNQNLSGKQLEFLTTIHRMSEFMLQLLDDLLDISAIESGTLTLNRRVQDYLALVRHSISLNSLLAEKKQMTITLECADPLPMLALDANKIEQVLNNLLSNAIKYSHPRTLITVRISPQANVLLTEVSDHGQGIPADDLPHIFQTFYRASVRATQGEKSTGLGLAIVKRIIEGHGGTIDVTSDVGAGSKFSFSLPIQADFAS